MYKYTSILIVSNSILRLVYVFLTVIALNTAKFTQIDNMCTQFAW